MIDKSGIHFGLGYLVWLQLFFSRYLSSFPSNLYSNPPFSSLLKMPSLLHTKFCMYLGPFLVFLFHFIHLTVCSISIFYLLELCKVLWYLIGLPFLPIFFLFFLMNFRITNLVLLSKNPVGIVLDHILIQGGLLSLCCMSFCTFLFIYNSTLYFLVVASLTLS